MTVFKSLQPDINLPAEITIFDFLFDPALSDVSPLKSFKQSELAGYVDGITKERVNWQEVKETSTYISTALVRKYGLKEGQIISLFSRNTIWYPVMMFAGIRAGGIISGASPAYNVEEMTYALKTAQAKFLATSSTSIEVAQKAAANVGIPKECIFLLEGEVEGYTTIKKLIEIGKSYGKDQVSAHKIPKGKKNKDVCAFLSFSSGTTGLPKAVMISHQNVIAQSLQIIPISPPDHKRVLAVLPLFHITGLVHILHIPVLNNAEVVMLPSFTMPSMLQAVVEYKIVELLLVPPLLIRLVRDPVVKDYDLGHIKRFSSGAAPVSKEILQEMERRFPGTGFKQGYGMTESCSCITAHTPEFYGYNNAHTVGAICASTEVKIVKEDGSEADVGEPGELLARGPQIVMGYLNNAKATEGTFDSEGFLHTGDQGVIDEKGLITITDRLKEMVKVKGIAVAPAELEDLLLGHEAVEDVAVLGIPDEYSGEVPKAFVVMKPGAKGRKPGKELGMELFTYVRERKVKHKWVKEVEFIEAIPKSPSGKILRRVLKDMAKEGKKGLAVRDEGRGKDAKL